MPRRRSEMGGGGRLALGLLGDSQRPASPVGPGWGWRSLTDLARGLSQEQLGTRQKKVRRSRKIN